MFSASNPTETDLPSSLPFAIPLTQDAPQCIHTPHSSLSHTLTATLLPTDVSLPSLTKSLTVHTRRYTSHSHILNLAPETYSLDAPTRVEVEIPRATFKAGEPIPIYVKIPPPRRELVVDQGLRLRNVRAELIREVKVKQEDSDSTASVLDASAPSESSLITHTNGSVQEGPSSAAAPIMVEKSMHASWSPKVSPSPTFRGASYESIVSRSGASCRFHSSLPVRLRFVLRQPPPSDSPSDLPRTLPDTEYGYLDGDTHCASITQETLLHSVTFHVKIYISFVDMSNRTERFSNITIPVLVIPPPAPLPEVEESVDVAYQKKHDRPPAKTVRLDDLEVSAPHYIEGEAGPSALPGGAPPPFEERDAPPPFVSHAAESSTSNRYAPPPFFLDPPEASTSSRLPTFLESETEIFVSSGEEEILVPSTQARPIIQGEGTWFGFSPSEQFDGHSEDMQRSSTPPPTLEMATLDTDVTNLADLNQPQSAMEALGRTLEQEERAAGGGGLPPPPPAMDDPSDPPPSIDSEFRTPELHLRHSPPPPPHPSTPPPHPTYSPGPEQSTALQASPPITPHGPNNTISHNHAPPPYLVPGNEGDQEHVTRPPPYMDLMPPTSDRR